MYDFVRELIGQPLRIGDGTAPPGFPAYSRHGEKGVQCDFNGCGHVGENGRPAKMPCIANGCYCPCCRMLAGEKVHGCTYGA